jgi:hypothetical protein
MLESPNATPESAVAKRRPFPGIQLPAGGRSESSDASARAARVYLDADKLL